MKQAPQRLSSNSDPRSQPFEVSQPTPVPHLPFRKMAYWVAGIGVLGLIGWAFRPAPIRVDMGQVQRGELQVTVDAEGKTRVRDRFVIAAGVDGHLARIALREGDSVLANGVVAQIDPLPLNASVQSALGQLAEWQAQRAGVATQRPKAKTIEQARIRIQVAEAQQRESEARVAQAKADLEQARRDRQRAQQLADSGAISRQDREVAELNVISRAKALEAAILVAKANQSAVDVARAALAVVQQEQSDPDYLLRVYDARIASTQAELSKLRDEAARTDIRSPVAGKVLRIHQKSAQFVTSGTPLMDIGDPTRLEIVIDVLSSDAVKIQPGNLIFIEPDGEPERSANSLQAKVRLVEPSAFTKVSALGVEEQRVNVIGDFVNPARSLGDAYRLDTRIVVWSGKNVLQVPISALFRCNQSSWCVFVVEQGKANQRQIQIGYRSDRAAEVKQGLQVGEQVILHPTEQVKESIRVTPR